MTTKLFYEHTIGKMHNLIWFLVFIYYVIAIIAKNNENK